MNVSVKYPVVLESKEAYVSAINSAAVFTFISTIFLRVPYATFILLPLSSINVMGLSIISLQSLVGGSLIYTRQRVLSSRTATNLSSYSKVFILTIFSVKPIVRVGVEELSNWSYSHFVTIDGFPFSDFFRARIDS